MPATKSTEIAIIESSSTTWIMRVANDDQGLLGPIAPIFTSDELAIVDGVRRIRARIWDALTDNK